MAETVSGIVERVTFHNVDSGYCVLKVTAKGYRDPITVVGSLPMPIAGEFIEATGDWIEDRNFGPQFRAAEMRTTPPHTKAGIVKYLGSGFVKGIGPKYAQKIVDRFGDRTLELMDRSIGFLADVPGIGPKRLAMIRDNWAESRAIRKIVVFLQSFGIGPKTAHRIYKQYGDTAIDLVRANPYRLTQDIWGVGFRTADELAQRIGIDRQSPLRATAAIRHTLLEASANGHVCLPVDVLREQTAALTDIPSGIIDSAIEQLIIDGELVRDESLVYLQSLHHSETGVARRLRDLMAGTHPLPVIDIDKAVAWAEKHMAVTLAPQQRQAVAQACRQKVLVITGGPGTGKTTLVRAVLDIFAAKRMRMTLAAPTGRAAKRLAESTGREAKTIHRLLEFDPASGRFRFQGDQPLETDLIVIDEASMLDLRLAHDLLQAIPPYACVLFVGDIDQLPSVGPGSVLGDLIASDVVPVVRLTVVHRQAAESWIVRAAHAINEGREPASAPPQSGDFYIVEADEPNTVVDKIVHMVGDRIPARFGFHPLRDIQVLCPMNRTDVGVSQINQRLQAALNPKGPAEVQRGEMTFRVGDKVLQTRNNYQQDVFNGDIGRIVDLHDGDQLATVEFDGRTVLYDYKDLDELALAYAITIHKSQGSEYPAVVIPVHTQNFIMLRRNLLYTGVTRGRKLVVLVGMKKAIGIAVNTADTSRRFGRLTERLRTLLADEA
jgi:exodeoxyribonuclease V alpha subunit